MSTRKSPFRALADAKQQSDEILAGLRQEIAQHIAALAEEAKKLDPQEAIASWMAGLKEIATGMGFSPDGIRSMVEEINYAYEEADGHPRLSTIADILERHTP